MFKIIDFFANGNHIQQAEIITDLAVLVVLGYFFYVLNVFKRG